MAFEAYRERIALSGTNQSDAIKNHSVQIMNQFFFGSTVRKSVTVDGEVYEARLIADKDFSIATTRESWKIQFKNNQVFPVGTYLYFDNRTWLVCKIEDLEVFHKMYILECTYLLKWYDNETWELKEYWCPVLPKNSYSPGVWSNVFSTFVDMETKIWLPNNFDTRKIVRDKRFIISNDDLNPTAYRVTKRDSSVLKGIMILGLSEDEVSPTIDDLVENIADKGKYQIETVFDFPAEYNLTVQTGEKYSLQVQAFKLNKYDGVKKKIDADAVTITSLNTDIAKVDGSIVTGVSEGSAVILLECNGSSRQIYATITSEFQNFCELRINGSEEIYLGVSANYEINTTLNGSIVEDEYRAEIFDSEGKNISVLARAEISGSKCVIKANSSNRLGYCVLRITSLTHSVVSEKRIRIKSVL